jgi:hypothetical protein
MHKISPWDSSQEAIELSACLDENKACPKEK